MSPTLIVAGVIVCVDPSSVDAVAAALDGCVTTGDVLVAFSAEGHGVRLQFVDEESATFVSKAAERSIVAAKRSRPSRKDYPWLYATVETEFDHVASEHQLDMVSEYERSRENALTSSRRPDSYRRWLSKTRRRWVRNVVHRGRRTSPTLDA